jgi:acetyl-CoA carboxylase carboxyl transferase subunit beta
MLFAKEYEANLSVCPRCDHHGRIGTDARFAHLLDPGFTVLPTPKVKDDPLKFRDTKKYPDRMKAARAANPHPDALTNALGKIEGNKVVLGFRTSISWAARWAWPWARLSWRAWSARKENAPM